MTAEKLFAHDGLEAKLPNRRVSLFPLYTKDGEFNSWGIEFRRLGDDRKVVETKLTLSDEAMAALWEIYGELSSNIQGPPPGKGVTEIAFKNGKWVKP